MVHLYFHGGSTNHGCEAIVRSTNKLLGQKLLLHTSNIEADLNYGLDEIVTLAEDVRQSLSKFSGKYLLHAVYHKLMHTDYLYTQFAHPDIFPDVCRGDIYMSIGGDNYCYKGTDILAHYNQILHKKGAKTILWGCSVEPALVEDAEIAADLGRYNLITARETISYEALKKVNPNTILVADPAFVLDRVDAALPEGWVAGKMVGINASPLIMDSGDGALVLAAYKKLIRQVLDTTEYSVVLIPHVVAATSDDRKPLSILLEEFKDTGRVIMIEDHNCMELKGYIARCRMFIGARTHATIAAYSTCVPTLVLGYSVKSRGIARDIFGTEEHYVIPVQGLKSNAELADGFNWLLDHEESIRQRLHYVMPGYISRASAAVSRLQKLMEA